MAYRCIASMRFLPARRMIDKDHAVPEPPTAARRRIEGEMEPQGLKPRSFTASTARLKSCPDTKRSLEFVRSRLPGTLFLRASIVYWKSMEGRA